ncbi:unnamed protein product [Acanthoscelides obtectus]|uniref:Uncharacterized protein n=1 Tax=Acanthoscelides obtectus TaxID=200917 RepID=A0A9P0L143_ACAOB|nr:unnamed protein product [Acanthoscelides obtectus]CAK1666292.1 hypothetical protein AOBTE_LOCUS25244 [Acanthoscelides obtectus]
MLCYLSAFLVISLNVQKSYSSNIEYDGSVTIRLQHALVASEDPVFTDRGNVTVHSLRLGQATINQRPLSPDEQLQLRVRVCDKIQRQNFSIGSI